MIRQRVATRRQEASAPGGAVRDRPTRGVGELRALLPFLLPYRLGLALGLGLVVIANVFSIASPKLLGLSIDALVLAGAGHRTLTLYAGLVVLAAVLGGAARFGMRKLLNGISRRVETDLRDAFFDHLLRLDAAFYNRMRTGDLMSRATNDLQAVRMAAGPAVMYLVNTAAITTFALALMLHTSAALTALALAPMLAIPPIVLGFGRIIHRRFSAIQEHFGRLSTFVQENLSGARIVRAYVQEEAQAREFDAFNRAYLDRNMALARTSAAFHPLLSLLSGVAMVIVLGAGGYFVMGGRISPGDFVAFMFYLSMLAWPMIALGWVINLFQRGAASMGRISLVLNTEPRVRTPAKPVRPGTVSGDIEFRDVRFRYDGGSRDVLANLSFRIPAGATYALVGPTGSGKSTLIALLARLHDPTEGQVLIDGIDLRAWDLSTLRSALGMVPQDTVLFSETLAANIMLGLETVDDAAESRIRAAAGIARLDEIFESFPEGLDTRLGERGVNLSGGQRQRTALARALARDPAVLVLDDALSAVDTRTETRILAALRGVLHARTALIVSHRVTAVHEADRILVLDNGRIAEEGSHAELIVRDGVYAALLRRQILEEGLAADPVANAPAAT